MASSAGVGSHEDTLEEGISLRSRCEQVSGGSSEGLEENTQARVLNDGEVNTYSCVYQVHLTQHAGVWDGIARVNEEILLTMLDIFEKHESKSVHEVFMQYPCSGFSLAPFFDRKPDYFILHLCLCQTILS